MNQRQLHDKLKTELSSIGLKATKAQLNNIAYWCQSFAFSSSSHLASLVTQLPLEGQRENLVQRFRRFLKNETLKPAVCFAPMVSHTLKKWPHKDVCLVMDRTDIKNRWSILMVGPAYKKRVLPLAWQLLPFGGTNCETQIKLLERLRPHIPAEKRVTYLGDSEFRAVGLQTYCRDKDWHWQVGVKGDTWCRTSEGQWHKLADLSVLKGERRYLSQIYLTKSDPFGPVNLIADWTTAHDSPRFWVLDLPASMQAWRRGRKRFWIEPTFRDWKSYGFDIEAVKIDHIDRLDKLMLTVCLSTLWMLHVGDWVCTHGYAHLIAPPHKHDYSLFRIGRDFLQRCRSLNWRIPVGMTVSG